MTDCINNVAVQQKTRQRYRVSDIKWVGGEYTSFCCSVSQEYSQFGQGRSLSFFVVLCVVFKLYVVSNEILKSLAF